MRSTHAINNIHKLMSCMNHIYILKLHAYVEYIRRCIYDLYTVSTMAWQQQQQQSQLQPQQQQTISMTTQMMPTTAMYMSSGGSVQMPSNVIDPAVGYVSAVPVTVRNPGIAETYLSQQSMGLGITLVVVGVLTSIFNGVGFAVSDEFAPIGHGFWCGALVCISNYMAIDSSWTFTSRQLSRSFLFSTNIL